MSRRSSIIIVDETRGAPLKIISFLMSFVFFVRGVQMLFFCGTPLPWSEGDRIIFETLGFDGCVSNPHRVRMSGMIGIHLIVLGVVRLKTSISEHVGELYQFLWLAVVVDILTMLHAIKVREVYWEFFFERPLGLLVSIPIRIIYEIYILNKARNADMQRRLTKPSTNLRSSVLVVSETRGAPGKFVSFILALVLFCRGVQLIFFCGQPIPGNEADRVIFEKLDLDCDANPFRMAMSGEVGIGLIFISMIRLQTAFTEHVAELYHSMLLVVLANMLYVVLAVMAWESYVQLPLIISLTLPIGMLHEVYVLYKARNAYIERRQSKRD